MRCLASAGVKDPINDQSRPYSKWGYLCQKSFDAHEFWTKYGGFVLIRADMIACKTPESTV